MELTGINSWLRRAGTEKAFCVPQAREERRHLTKRSIAWLTAILRAFAKVCTMRGRHKNLVVRETATLGERRLVAVVEFEAQRFLIGASPSAITLLAQLPDQPQSLAEADCRSGERG